MSNDTHKVSITMHGDKVAIDETVNASHAFIAANGARSIKRMDRDSATDADIIIDEARPLVDTQSRSHLSNAAKAQGDWRMRAALVKRALQMKRSIR